MTVVRAHGIEADLPAGFDGRIFRRAATGGARTRAVAHLASFALPASVADFGGGAVERMGPGDVLVILFEYGPESLGTRLFARPGMPRRLRPGDFRRTLLRRGIPGQAGTQWFFTEAARPFTLYAVVAEAGVDAGRAAAVVGRAAAVGKVNAVLAGIRFDRVVPTG